MFIEQDDLGVELVAPGEERNYLAARPGDHLFAPFECDFCSFFRLKGRSPNRENPSDSELLLYLRRSQLDVFWSRRPGTVKALLGLYKEQRHVGDHFAITMFRDPGPFPADYDCGTAAAVGVLWRSRKPGRDEKQVKFSSARKARSVYTDMYKASATGWVGASVWRSEKDRFVTTKGPTDSEWFSMFMSGFYARVGYRRNPDAAISIALMIKIQEDLEWEWRSLQDQETGSLDSKRAIAEEACWYLLSYCASLRGFEVPKIVLTELRGQIQSEKGKDGSPAHIGVPLRGRFKARSNAVQKLLVFVAYETQSGLKPGRWVSRLVSILQSRGIQSGWLFQKNNGEPRKMSEFNEAFYSRLARLQQQFPNLFSAGSNVYEDFGLPRSFRRGATTRAQNAGVKPSDIDWINRWNTGGEEFAGGPMRVQYSDRKQLLQAFLRFSQAL